MKCVNHPDRDAVASCKTCGKGLCQECACRITPLPQCIPCFKNDLTIEKREIVKSLVLSTIVGIVAFILFFTYSEDPSMRLITAIMFFGVGFGWSALNKITPEIFLFLPLIGWVFYFIIKMFLSVFIGIFACPYKLYTGIKRIKEINQQLSCA